MLYCVFFKIFYLIMMWNWIRRDSKNVCIEVNELYLSDVLVEDFGIDSFGVDKDVKEF